MLKVSRFGGRQMDNRRRLSVLDDSQGISSYGQPTVAVIICDDPSSDLDKLTAKRCKAALPFAGKYRLIDLALSNCVNSEIDTVGVLTQYRPRSLHAHLRYGRPWDLDRRKGGLTLLHPYQAHATVNWYTGSADALYKNLDFCRRQQSARVLVLVGSQAYGMDFVPMIAQHRRTTADLTIATVRAHLEPPQKYYTLHVGDDGRVHGMLPPSAGSDTPMIAMGAFLFSANALQRHLVQDAAQGNSRHDLFDDLIPYMIQAGDRVMAFQHLGYWNGLQTVNDYWQAGMDLLSESPRFNLQDAAWPIRTQPDARPPTRVSSGARISHSLISQGCLVDGTVEYSILSPGVSIAPGAVVRHSIVMHNTLIEERALVENAILDMDVTVGQQAHVGRSRRCAPTVHDPEPVRLTIVGEGARIPAHETVVPGAVEKEWLFAQTRAISNNHVDAA